MTWNHRILAHDHKGEIYLQIHEVHYDEDGKPWLYSKNPTPISGDDLKSIRWTLNKMKESISKPILWAGDKFPEEMK